MITTTQISYGKEELEAECLAHLGVRSDSQTLSLPTDLSKQA